MSSQDMSSQERSSQDRSSQDGSRQDRASQDRLSYNRTQNFFGIITFLELTLFSTLNSFGLNMHLRMEFDSGVGPTCFILYYFSLLFLACSIFFLFKWISPVQPLRLVDQAWIVRFYQGVWLYWSFFPATSSHSNPAPWLSSLPPHVMIRIL